ncbi:MAG: sigma-70 family RNA polymerase sigma factor [Planctomycetota bacterium]
MPVDPNTAHPEAILATSRWIRSLARQLVADEALQDDVVQETLLTAIEKAPRQSQALYGWLQKVVRSRVWLHHRKQTRRLRREKRVAQKEEVPSEVVLAERMELQQKVTEAVLQLPEPYRRTVILRYLEEMSPSEIARRLRLPASTVRSRLHRAHQQLKQLLHAEYGSRDAWCVALLPLAAPAPALSTMSLNPGLIGGSIVKVKSLALPLLLLLLALAGGSLIWRTGEAPQKNSAGKDSQAGAPVLTGISEEKETAPSGSKVESVELASAAEHLSAQEPAPARDSDSQARSSTEIAVVKGRIWHSEGESLQGARVFLWGGGQPGSVVDGEGYFNIESPYEMSTSLYLEMDGFQLALNKDVLPTFDSELFVEIEVEAGEMVEGLVVARDTGQLVEDAALVLRSSAHRGQAGAVFFHSDGDGAFTLRFIPEGNYKVEVDHPEFTHKEARVKVPGSEKVILELHPARALEVTVQGIEDYPNPGQLYLQCFKRVDPKHPESLPENVTLKGTPDETGRYTLNAPSPGRWQLELFGRQGLPRVRKELWIPKGTQPVALELVWPARGRTTVEGRVVDASGEPVSGGTIHLGRDQGVVAEDGAYQLNAVESGLVKAAFSMPGWYNGKIDLGQLEIEDLEEIHHEIRLPGTCSLEISIEGAPRDDAEGSFFVELVTADAQSRHVAYCSGEPNRSILVSYLAEGRYVIIVRLGNVLSVFARKEVELFEGDERHSVLFRYRPPTAYRIRLLTAGEELPESIHTRIRGQLNRTVKVTDGEATLHLWQEGTHDLEVMAVGFEMAKVTLQVQAEQGSVTEVLLKKN